MRHVKKGSGRIGQGLRLSGHVLEQIDETHIAVHEVLNLLKRLARFTVQSEIRMAQELDDLVREVEETRGSFNSAKTMIAGLAAKINELATTSGDAVAIKAKAKELAADLNSMQEDFAAATASNPSPGEGGGPQGGVGRGSEGGVGGGGPSEGGVVPPA